MGFLYFIYHEFVRFCADLWVEKYESTPFIFAKEDWIFLYQEKFCILTLLYFGDHFKISTKHTENQYKI